MDKEKVREKIVAWIKDCGQSIIDNAETIYGGYEYQTGDIVITVTINDEEFPKIDVCQQLVPEQTVKRGIVCKR